MSDKRSRRLLIVLSLLADCSTGGPAARAEAYETPAHAAILIDLQSGQDLYAKNADVPLHPASMSKLMTALMVFERLADGSLSLDDTLPVSEKAWRKGGSKMFVELGVAGAGRGSPARHHRAVGQRCLHRRGRSARRHRGGVQRADDQARARARADPQHLQECERLAGPGPPHERARPRHARDHHHPRNTRSTTRSSARRNSPTTTSASTRVTRCSIRISAPTA